MPSSNRDRLFDESVSSLLGRAYYLNLGLLEKMLELEGLNDSVRPSMCNVLFALFSEDGQKISSIASKIRVAKSTMTGTVEGLRKRELINVTRDRRDRRAQRLELTEKAKSLEPALRKTMENLESQISAELTDEEQQLLCKLLTRSIAGMESRS